MGSMEGTWLARIPISPVAAEAHQGEWVQWKEHRLREYPYHWWLLRRTRANGFDGRNIACENTHITGGCRGTPGQMDSMEGMWFVRIPISPVGAEAHWGKWVQWKERGLREYPYHRWVPRCTGASGFDGRNVVCKNTHITGAC